jgi:hypothetical protein
MSVNRYRITPTPSNTPSNTPSITPSLSSCPGLRYYFQPSVEICNEAITGDTLDLTGYTLTFDGVDYNTLTDNVFGLTFAQYCAVGPIIYGTTGSTYRFDFRIDNPNYELCGEPASGFTYDRVDIVLTNYVGEFIGFGKEWDTIQNHYLNDVLVYSQSGTLTFYDEPNTDNPNCPNVVLAFTQFLRFIVREKVITPTPTPTATPLCPDTFTLTQTAGTPVNIQEGLYNRITSNTGGTFNYGFFSGSPQQFFTGTAPNGRNYLVYERQVGGFWTDIGFYYAAVGTPPSVNVWKGITTTGSSFVNGAPFASISGNVVLASASTFYNSTYIPPFSETIGGRSWTFDYPALCPTNTPTPTSTLGSTPTQTPSQTATLTPTTTPTLTVCPETNNCMAFTITGATEEFFPSIEYNNCYGTLIAEAFTTNGTRYRCVQFTMGVPQIFSYTGMEEPTIYGGNCNSFDCPGGVVPLTPTPTPTITQTSTPSATIGATATQTPNQTATLTPTTTPTLTVCPDTNVCMALTVTGATEEFFPSIEYNNCFGTLINEAFTTNGTRYRCIQYLGGVPQIFSYTGMEEPTIFGGNCNTFECPTDVVPLTPTPTQTITQTSTPSATIGATPTNTQTQTNTPTQTQTNTPTPSITPPVVSANIDITNSSLDISISEVYVNAVLTTVAGGTMPNTTGNGTNLSTTQVGVYDILIFYSSGVAGQNISLTDSDNVSTCQNTLTGGNSMTFFGVKVASYQNVLINATDGTCS